MASHSQLFLGKVMHARLRPRVNQFVYRVFWLKLRLDETPASNWLFGINCARPLSIRWQDYGLRDGSHPLVWARHTLAQQNIKATGAIWLQTFPRIWGYVFNPVSFFYCHDEQGGLRAVLAAVNNTFGDWHTYVITAPDGGAIDSDSTLICQKLMHVSPFCAIAGHYEFRFTAHAAHIDYHDDEGLLIKTAISGQAYPASSAHLLRALASHPLQSLGVMVRIHWQALRLWLAKIPFHRQPGLHRGGVSRSEQESSS